MARWRQPGAPSRELGDRRRAGPVSLAVRDDDALPLHLRPDHARAGASARRDADAGPPEASGTREVATADPLLRRPLHDQLRDRSCYRPRAGVPVRDELGRLLELRGRRVRGTARDRGPRRVHARVDVHRALGVRSRPTQPEGAPAHDLPRLARHLGVGLLHRRRQLLDAEPGRLPDQPADRTGRGHRHPPDPLSGVHRRRLRPRDPRRTDDRRVPRARGRRMASPQASQRRSDDERCPVGDPGRATRDRDPDGVGQRVRRLRHRRAAHEDRLDRGAVGHGAARRVLADPDRRLYGRGSDADLRARDPRSPLVPLDELVQG